MIDQERERVKGLIEKWRASAASLEQHPTFRHSEADQRDVLRLRQCALYLEAVLSSPPTEPLSVLRAIVYDYQQGALDRMPSTTNGSGKHKRAAERRELQTIAKTLNVVLGEIDKLAASPSVSVPASDQGEER